MKRLFIVGAMALSAPAMAQSSQFDGEYGNPNGAMGSSGCSSTRFGYRLSVHNGEASMRTVTAGVLEGPVKPDGSIAIQQGPASLTGKISGPKFNGNLQLGKSGTCYFALDYTKLG